VNRCSAPVSALHSSVFSRLASGAFYKTIVPVTFYEIINVALKPILRWKTKILALKRVRDGDSVSFGRAFVCQKDSLIVTLPVGYVDRYCRRLSNRAEVLVRGRRVKVAGVVCMDLPLIDVSDIPGVQVGDEVILLGKQRSEEIHVFELARWAETIPYEIFCGTGKRVPRLYAKEKG
jgi:alanine racemase